MLSATQPVLNVQAHLQVNAQNVKLLILYLEHRVLNNFALKVNFLMWINVLNAIANVQFVKTLRLVFNANKLRLCFCTILFVKLNVQVNKKNKFKIKRKKFFY